jgi:glycosyltransferase involved in cell wall biosynthesis
MNDARRDRPTVSVVLAVRNASTWIEQAMRGLAAQTFRSFEVIVVDDGSSDDTAARVRKFPARYPVRLVAARNGAGVANARNEGLEQASGEYVWFTDVDDGWDPRFLATMVDLVTVHDADVGICRARQSAPGESGGRILGARGPAGAFAADDAKAWLLRDIGALWNKLIRRDLLGSDPFPPLRSKSDHAGLLRIVHRVERVAVTHAVLYHYVRHPRSISNGGVVEPENQLWALAGLRRWAVSRGPAVAQAVDAFEVDAYARTIRETCRFAEHIPDHLGRVKSLAAKVPVTRAVTLLPGNPIPSVTCIAARISPRVTSAVVRGAGQRLFWQAT